MDTYKSYFKIADTDGNGKIDFEEFKNAILKYKHMFITGDDSSDSSDLENWKLNQIFINLIILTCI